MDWLCADSGVENRLRWLRDKGLPFINFRFLCNNSVFCFKYYFFNLPLYFTVFHSTSFATKPYVIRQCAIVFDYSIVPSRKKL